MSNVYNGADNMNKETMPAIRRIKSTAQHDFTLIPKSGIVNFALKKLGNLLPKYK